MRQEPAGARGETSHYYAIRSDVTYRVMDGERVVGSGMGITRAMSARRLILYSETCPQPGAIVELSMAWPVLLENRIPLKLVIKGRAVEIAGGIAVDILSHEFRTQAVHTRNGYPAASGAGVRTLSAGG